MNKKIELKLDENENNDLQVITVICTINKDTTHELAILKELLEPIGINIEASHYESNCVNSDYLTFIINREKYNKIVKRNAGRKKDCNMKKRYKECTVADLKKMLETMKKTEIIAELGCPAMTFYRILKKIDFDFNDENYNNTSIWYF